MNKKDFTILSEYDGLPLQATVYEPNGEKKGILQVLHGMGEYKERYDEFMRYFCERGYVVVCHDHRGHGDSVRKAEDRGYFYELSGTAVVEDAAQITREMKKNYPALPVVLFGHSMGSMVARCYLQTHDELVDKAIVCGSPSKNPLAGVAIALEKCIRFFRGERHRSKLLSYLSTGKGDKKFKGEGKGAWLSHDRENIEKFYSDPKGKNGFTCNGFENLFRLMQRTYQSKLYQVKNPDLPVLFVSGSSDPVMGNEKKWRNGMELMRKAGYKNVRGKLYADMRHEIHNDTKKEEVLADLLSFMEK